MQQSLSTLLVCLMLSLLMTSCKKTDSITKEEPSVAHRFDKLSAIEQQKLLSFDFGKQTQLINRTIQSDLLEIGGVQLHRQSGSIGARTIQDYCDDASLAPPDEVTLVSIDRTFACNQGGYTLTGRWKISTVFDLSTSNPNNSSQKSRGRMRIKNSSGSIIWQNLSIVPVTFVNTGVDPSDPEKRIWEVAYTTGVIPSSILDQSNITMTLLHGSSK